MSSSFLRSTYRRMMKYFLRKIYCVTEERTPYRVHTCSSSHWCMEIKYDGNSKKSRSTKKNRQDGCQKSDEYDKQNRNNENNNDQMTKANLDKRIDDDGILFDAQLEWEHEEGIEHSPKPYRKSEQDLLDIILTQSPQSTSSKTYIRAPYCPDFEWDHLFDFPL